MLREKTCTPLWSQWVTTLPARLHLGWLWMLATKYNCYGHLLTIEFLFTFNIGDFQQLARRIPEHRGILLASQQSFKLKELITLLDHVLLETDSEEWVGQVRWLSDWR